MYFQRSILVIILVCILVNAVNSFKSLAQNQQRAINLIDKLEFENVTSHIIDKLIQKYPKRLEPFKGLIKRCFSFDDETTKQRLAPQFLQYFDRREIQDLIRFFSLPIGRKFAQFQGPLLLELGEIVREKIEKYEDQFKATFRQQMLLNPDQEYPTYSD